MKVLTTFCVRAIVSSRFRTVCHHPPKHRERERGEREEREREERERRERERREIQDGMPPPTQTYIHTYIHVCVSVYIWTHILILI